MYALNLYTEMKAATYEDRTKRCWSITVCDTNKARGNQITYNDKPVDVTVTLGTQPIDTKGFETPLLLAIHNVFHKTFSH
ncbi:tail tip assembly protein [Salmonella phage 41]|nr:tail tip assembly protein [Salmonella phage 41]